MKFFSLVFVFTLSSFSLVGQGHIIHLRNSSFESIPSRGSNNAFFLPGWGDCAPRYFRNETPPDIHSENTDYFSVNRKPLDGNTFVGMVTRGSNETWEMISQKLNSPMLQNKCYEFKISLAKSDVYLSKEKNDTTHFYNFNKPVKLRIWGSSTACKKSQLLAESNPVNHSEWKEYTFRFKPKQFWNYILLEVFYKTPVLVPYNGNILIDRASDLIEVPCPNDDEILAQVDINTPVIEQEEDEEEVQIVTPHKTKDTTKNIKPDKQIETIVEHKSKDKPKSRILKKLDKKTIIAGQTIKIEKLYFKADSAKFQSGSNEVLDEIFNFLVENPDVIIEIGGHTNGIPGVNYCNRLSTERAKNVANYLYRKGIPKYRIKYRGYGKSKPLASDRTMEGRKKNQRVEIKILRTGKYNS